MKDTTSPKIPRSIDGLYDLVNQAFAHGTKLRDENDRTIDTSFLGTLGRVRNRFNDLMDGHDALLREKAELIEQQRAHGVLLLEELNMARMVLIVRATRAMASDAIFSWYGAHPTRAFSVSPVRMTILEVAEKFLEGEALATAEDGFPPMVEPTAAELQALIDEARPIFTEVRATAVKLRASRKTMRDYRNDIYLELRKLLQQLRHDLKELDPSAIRDFMRDFGFQFDDLSPTPSETQTNPETNGNTEGQADAKEPEKSENSDTGTEAQAEQPQGSPEAEGEGQTETTSRRPRRFRSQAVESSVIAEIRAKIRVKVYGTSAPDQAQPKGTTKPSDETKG